MKDAIAIVHSLATADHPATRYDLEQILGALHTAFELESGAADADLLALMLSNRTISLRPGSPPPHAMPPEELVKLLVVQYFLRKDPQAYLHHVEHLRDGARGTLRAMIQSHLDDALELGAGAS